MFSYVAYGLGIHSVLALPELEAREVAADVVVRLGPLDYVPLEAVDDHHSFWASADEACHCFRDAGRFLVRGGHEIIVDPIPEVDRRLVHLSLLGPALALILLQRGRFVLHASAVAIAGSAIAFVGGSGWGKSTMAAALHARGHRMVSDDVTAIDTGSSRPMVIPSFPQFKLWPEAITALGAVPDTLPLIHPNFEKRTSHITERFAPSPVPLKRLYVLARGPVMELEPLQPQEAIRELMRHWYGARYGAPLLRVMSLPVHFLQCASLANDVRVCRLKRPTCLSALPKLARLVEEELAHA